MIQIMDQAHRTRQRLPRGGSWHCSQSHFILVEKQ